MRWGGGGTPSIDEPDDEKPKVFPQPEVEFDDQDYEEISCVNLAEEMFAETAQGQGFGGGDGTANNPYVISNFDELLYFLHYCNTGTGQHYGGRGKNYSLTENISLNDGYFEENGTYHDGGDGKLYVWKESSQSPYNSVFEGNGKIISGLFNNSGGCFIYSLTTVRNLTLNIGLLNYPFYSVTNLKNVIVKGNVKGGSVSGIAQRATYVENCINYANLRATGYYSGGIVFNLSAGGYIKNCINYGNLSSTGLVWEQNGGIVGNAGSRTTIQNCKNYGNLSPSTVYSIGGIVGDSSGCDIINCVNYGAINPGSISHCGTGGIVGQIKEGNVNIINCKNYGYIKSGGYLIGAIGQNSGKTSIVNVSDCYISNKLGNGQNFKQDNALHPLFESTYDNNSLATDNRNAILNVKNIRVDIDNITSNQSILLGEIRYQDFSYNARDIEFNLNFNTSNQTLGMFKLRPTTTKARNMFLKNILVNISSEYNVSLYKTLYSNSNQKDKLSEHDNLNISSLVVCNKKHMEFSKYFGDNFDFFYVAWKDNHIGLRALDGIGLYQWTVNEDILKNLGYTKMD